MRAPPLRYKGIIIDPDFPLISLSGRVTAFTGLARFTPCPQMTFRAPMSLFTIL